MSATSTLAVSSAATDLAHLLVISVLAVLMTMSLRRHPVAARDVIRRLPRCAAGLALFGAGIACFFAGDLGTGPWDVLHAGIAERTGLEIGLVINLVGLAVLLLWLPLGERVGVGTVLNAIEIGLVVDLVRPRLPETGELVVRVGYTFTGLVLIAFGSGLYIGAGLGAGPRDGIMLGLKRLGLSLRAARTLVEAVTMALGGLLGGRIGVGTVIFLVGIGPLVQFFLTRLSPPVVAPVGPTTG